MKILIYTQYFWPENFTINELALSLQAEGHEVEVLTGKPNYPEGLFYDGYRGWNVNTELWNGVLIHRVPIIRRFKKSAIGLFLNYLSFIVSGCIFSCFIIKKKVDVVFVYAPSPLFQAIPASFFGKIKRLPVVLWVQDLWPESLTATGYIKSKMLLQLLNSLVRFTYRNVDLILAQSMAFIDPIKKLAPNKKIHYLPNSVDDSFYSPCQHAKCDVLSLNRGFTVLFAGNIGAAQSIPTIVGAASLLLDFVEIHFVIVGSGSMDDWLREQKCNMNLHNLHIEGRYPQDQMPVILSKASILLVSLTSSPIFGLTIPNKIQAYLAAGKPIIGSLNGEGARIIEEAGAGICVPAESSEALADAIVKMYNMSRSELEQIGRNGRDYFKKNFSQDKLTKDLVEYFELVKSIN